MRERSLTILGLRIRVVEAAPAVERDDPVLMIHGLAGWAENWRPLFGPVAATGRRAIAIDLPGYGQSERPRRARYFDPADPFYAKVVFGTLDALGLGRVHLIGHSFGGAVAYTCALWMPDRVRSLALIAPGGLGPDLARGFRILTLPGAEVVARIRSTPSLSRAVLRACFHDPSRCPEELEEEAVRYGRSSVAEMVSVLRATVSFRRGVRADVRQPWIDRRSRYAGPVLVVWGREDAILPVSHAQGARDLAPQADVRIIDACGHLVMVERTTELLEILLPFLDGAPHGDGWQDGDRR